MAIEFTCPHCDHLLRTADDKAGLSAKCPACGEVIWVPLTGQPSPPAASANTGGDALAPPPPPLPRERASTDARAEGIDDELPRRRARVEVKCPNCSAANNASAQSCRFCGSSLAGAEPVDSRSAPIERTPDAGEAFTTAWTVYTSRFGLLLGASLLMMPVSFVAMMIAGAPTAILVMVLEEADVIDQSTAEVIGPLSMLPLTLLMLAVLIIGVIKLHQNVASGIPAANIGDLFYGLGSEGRRLIPGMLLLMGIVLLSGLTLVGPLVLWPLLQLHVDQRMSLGNTFKQYGTRISTGFGLVILSGMIVAGIGFVNGILIYPCCIGLFLFPFVFPFLQTLRAVAYLRWSGQRTAVD